MLSRILGENSLLNTNVGALVISAASVDEACVWCLLALVVSTVNAGSPLDAFYVFLLLAFFVAVMLTGKTFFFLLFFLPLSFFLWFLLGKFMRDGGRDVKLLPVCWIGTLRRVGARTRLGRLEEERRSGGGELCGVCSPPPPPITRRI